MFGARGSASFLTRATAVLAAASGGRVVAAARRHWPDLVIYARARDRAHAARLIARGASHAIPETIEASLQLGEMVLMGVGVPDAAARRLIEARRQAEQAVVDESRRQGSA